MKISRRLERSRNYYKTHKDQWVRYRLENKEKIREYLKKYRKENRNAKLRGIQKLKEQILIHYGNNKLSCVICGEGRLDCLSIDHINDNGAEHRRELGIIGGAFYRWLRRNDYPPGYQTLCMNCQFIKRFSKIRKDLVSKYGKKLRVINGNLR